MGRKIRTTINLNEDIVRKAKNLKINISAIAEMCIINYIKELENIRNDNKNSSKVIYNKISQRNQKKMYRNNETNDQVGLLRFELKSMAPEATRIPNYHTSPNLYEHYY